MIVFNIINLSKSNSMFPEITPVITSYHLQYEMKHQEKLLSLKGKPYAGGEQGCTPVLTGFSRDNQSVSQEVD